MSGTDILVINAHEQGGGAEFVYREMVERLSLHHVVGTLSGGAAERPRHVRLPDRKGSQALSTLLSPLFGWLAFHKVLAAILADRPRVVVVHNLWPTVGLGGLAAMALARRFLGTRCVLVAHDFQYVCATSMLYDFSAKKPCRACLGRRFKVAPIRRGCDKGGRLASVAKAFRLLLAKGPLSPARVFHETVAPSRTLADALVADGFDPATVSVVPNGLSVSVPTSMGRGPVIVFAGRLEPEKGADLLPEVAAAVLQDVPDARVVILGGGSLLEHVSREVERRGLQGSVEVTGPIPREEVMRRAVGAKVFLFPSRWVENCPLSLAEAVACGLVPVVGTDCTAAVELLARIGVRPVLAPAEAQALAAACVRALNERLPSGVSQKVAEAHDPVSSGTLTDEAVFRGRSSRP